MKADICGQTWQYNSLSMVRISGTVKGERKRRLKNKRKGGERGRLLSGSELVRGRPEARSGYRRGKRLGNGRAVFLGVKGNEVPKRVVVLR